MEARSHPTLWQSLRALPHAVRVLDVGIFVNSFGTFLPIFIVLYLARQGYSPAQATLGLSAYGLGALLGSGLGGYLADRYGRRNTIVVAMIVAAATVIMVPIAHPLPLITLFTALSGAGTRAAGSAGAALVADLVPATDRQPAFALSRLALNLGFAAGPAAAAFLAARSFRLLFAGDALASLAFALITLVLLPRDMPPLEDREKGSGFLSTVRSDHAFVLLLMAVLLVHLVYWQQLATLPLVVRHQGLPASAYGLLISLNGLIVILCELPLTTLTRRLRPQTAIAIGFLLIGAGFALLGIAGSLVTLALCVLVWTLGEIAWDPVASAYVADLAPPHLQGQYQAALSTTIDAAYVVAPALGGQLYAWSPVVLWIVCGGVGLTAMALVASSPRVSVPRSD